MNPRKMDASESANVIASHHSAIRGAVSDMGVVLDQLEKGIVANNMTAIKQAPRDIRNVLRSLAAHVQDGVTRTGLIADYVPLKDQIAPEPQNLDRPIDVDSRRGQPVVTEQGDAKKSDGSQKELNTDG